MVELVLVLASETFETCGMMSRNFWHRRWTLPAICFVWFVVVASGTCVPAAEFDPIDFGQDALDDSADDSADVSEWNWPTAIFPRWIKSTDERIGDPTVSYKDPEFAPNAPLVTWQEEDGRIWICGYNQQTGDLVPRDGRGVSPGVGVPLFSPFTSTITQLGTNNGPEWGLSREGLSVYFLQGDRTLGYRVSQYNLRDRELKTVSPPDVPIALGAFASREPHERVERLLYGRWVNSSVNPNLFVGQWLTVGRSTSPTTFPVARVGTSGPQWIRGERAIVTTENDAQGVTQIARFDIESGITTQLTDGPGNKTDGFFVRAPELFGRSVLCCQVDNEKIAFYRAPRPRETVWQLVREITPPASLTVPVRTTGIAPIVYRGKTYVAYLATLGFGDARICMGSLDGAINTIISDTSTKGRLDPEVLVTNGKLFVYYWIGGGKEGNIAELHRCRLRVFP